MNTCMFVGVCVGGVLFGLAVLVGCVLEGVCRNMPRSSHWHVGSEDPPVGIFLGLGIGVLLFVAACFWVITVPLGVLTVGCYLLGRWFALRVVSKYEIRRRDEHEEEKEK